MTIESVWWDDEHQCQVIVTPMPGRVFGTVTAAEDDSFVVLIPFTCSFLFAPVFVMFTTADAQKPRF